MTHCWISTQMLLNEKWLIFTFSVRLHVAVSLRKSCMYTRKQTHTLKHTQPHKTHSISQKPNCSGFVCSSGWKRKHTYKRAFENNTQIAAEWKHCQQRGQYAWVNHRHKSFTEVLFALALAFAICAFEQIWKNGIVGVFGLVRHLIISLHRAHR